MLSRDMVIIGSLESERRKLWKEEEEITRRMRLSSENNAYYEDVLSRIDLKIKEINEEIEYRTQKMEEREKFESLSDEEQKRIINEKEKKEIEEEQELQESLKKSAYRKLKKAYKKIPLSDRILSRLHISRIKSPKWKQVKNLSLEEMQFILDLKTGSTLQQEEVLDRRTEKWEKTGYSYSEIKEKKREKQQRDFMVALSNKNRLKEKMEREESLKGRSL